MSYLRSTHISVGSLGPHMHLVIISSVSKYVIGMDVFNQNPHIISLTWGVKVSSKIGQVEAHEIAF